MLNSGTDNELQRCNYPSTWHRIADGEYLERNGWGWQVRAQIQETDRRAVRFDTALVPEDFYVARGVPGGRVKGFGRLVRGLSEVWSAGAGMGGPRNMAVQRQKNIYKKLENITKSR